MKQTWRIDLCNLRSFKFISKRRRVNNVMVGGLKFGSRPRRLNGRDMKSFKFISKPLRLDGHSVKFVSRPVADLGHW